MPTIYNKVVLDGTTLMDISDTTATASDVAQGKYFYTTAGVKTEGTASGSSGTPAISVVDTTDSHGGTVREITALDISDTTAIASDVASGKYFYTANGTKTLGTGSSGSSETGQIATGTVTGDGTNILEIPCNFAPDLIYVYGDMSDDVANRGVVSLTIIKDEAIYLGFDSSTSSAQENTGSMHGIIGYNESDTSNIHATYSNGVLTIDTVSNSTSGKWRSGQVYNYELSTIGSGGGSSSPTLVTKEIISNGTYTASNDSADGYSSVTVNVPSSGITPTGSINITTNGTHDVTNYASAVVNVSGGGGSSATQHSIYFEFIDSTNVTVPIYYDDSSFSSVITTSKPSTYNNKQVTLAQLDGTTWYSPKPIPLNTQLIDYTKMKDHYGISGDDGTEEEYEWSSVTEYIPIDRNMTFTYVNYKWFGLYFYDTNKTYIKAFSPMDDGAVVDEYDRGHGTLDGGNIPQGAEYVRFVTELGANDANEVSLIRIA